jgi:ribosomal protein L11 methylase PrmA
MSDKKVIDFILKIPITLFSKKIVSNLILEGFKDLNILYIKDNFVYLKMVLFFKGDYDFLETVNNKIVKLKSNWNRFYNYSLDELNLIEVIDIRLFDYEEYIGGYIEPFSVGNFVFLPYSKKEIYKDEYVDKELIYLEPKFLAFGNERHPTTLSVLEIIYSLVSGDLKKDITKFIDLGNIDVVVDYGSGNGILSLVSKYFNPKLILAIEAIFSYTLEIKNNFRINNLVNSVVINAISPKIFSQKKSFKNSILLANIPFSVFKDLQDQLFTIDFGLFILSGIKEEFFDNFKDILKYYNLNLLKEIYNEGWYSFICYK